MCATSDAPVPPCFKVALSICRLAIAGLMISVVGCSSSKSPTEQLTAARVALETGDFGRVTELVEDIPQDAAEWQSGQLLAGEAASKEGLYEIALAYYRAGAEHDESTPDGQLALFSAAEINLQLGRLSEAETQYRGVLKQQPGNGLTNERMAFLLSLTGRRWESLNHYFVLIRGGDATLKELGLAADVGRPIEQQEFLAKSRRLSPNNVTLRLALAVAAYNDGHADAATQLQALVSDSPRLTAAHAMLGELIVDKATVGEFVRWHQALPDDADDNPDIWFVRGMWARSQADLETAAECFWQTVARTPFHRRAFYMLGQLLIAIDASQAKEVVEYAELLIALSQSIDQALISEGANENALRRTVTLLEQLGRLWEACAWAVVARERFPESNWPAQFLETQGGKLTTELPLVVADRNPAAGHPLESSHRFQTLLASVSARQFSSSADATVSESVQAAIRFDEAAFPGFRYFNGEDPQTKGARAFEQTGGGVAILDFDLDLAPDVFLSQGAEWKTGELRPSMSGSYVDGLFRNVSGEVFEDVSHALYGPDTGFGQGCSAGDFDNDGFPDLYVANTHRNGLYRNMGDGTFSDSTAEAGIVDESWTVSVMVADLNADGLPDLYDVNYLAGEDVFVRICQGRACSPSVFSGAQDRVLINQGDGQFLEAVDATPSNESKGLGIVAFELDVPRRPQLFIANDQVANHFLENAAADNPHSLKLTNHAVTTGLAFNDNGLPMACMGIAVADWDRNNLTDLFVTNFHNESNTLYLQDASGLFTDATRTSGLLAPSVPFTGWGTQALDADLDGWPDLVVVNGHVDDHRDQGTEYHMRPQFFWNRAGRFQELSADALGPWFGGKYLGRGVARVDWNRDGLPDFVVSNMNATVSVMRNSTESPGHFLKVRVTATQSARDAVGCRISASFDEQQVTHQLFAGDGYMACNERVVTFATGSCDSIAEVVIRWPSGNRSVIRHPPIDSQLIVVESSEAATWERDSRISQLPVVLHNSRGL